MNSESESERVSAVREETTKAHTDGLSLLRALANSTNDELADLNDQEADDRAFQFRLIVLNQSVNAAWKITELIETGYPRLAVYMARLLREGHIAFEWSLYNSQYVSDLMTKLMESRSVVKGHWPIAGIMAQQVVDAKRRAGEPDAEQWNAVILTLGDTHNEIFSHSVSDFSLTNGFELQDGKLSLAVGPVYNSWLVSLALDHCIPLAGLMLGDAARLIINRLGRDIEPEAARVHARLQAWLPLHPPPVLRNRGSLDQSNRDIKPR